jgi:multicomponent Na+:H+ antiporter subunit B
VIFVAGLAILSILKRPEDDDSHLLIPVTERHEERDMITIITCQMIVPVIQLFALYVIAHGHYSPGGGFQGGVMLGASYILIALTAGLPEALERLSEQRALFLAALGVAIYAGTGLLCMFLGENFLDYHILSKVLPVASGIQARYHSMLIVEIGVAFTVMSIMFLIYAVLSSKGRMRGGL